ncbi:unnamed protein product [Kuraishia capsulata CBS 1993]|uniref:Uncharacterized protein n=1 Tax=Kuraishia capsulata CBS 1993 TaxID=1382522 RepID=W6MLQ8_9ASCO|nr:uncharacterized protein KUCA_T00003432001 [Kuraishia capsulata CBS 1993]CDK27454.1 unnamed protein product [Kuraishia capsulata CBS 1993]
MRTSGQIPLKYFRLYESFRTLVCILNIRTPPSNSFMSKEYHRIHIALLTSTLILPLPFLFLKLCQFFSDYKDFTNLTRHLQPPRPPRRCRTATGRCFSWQRRI